MSNRSTGTTTKKSTVTTITDDKNIKNVREERLNEEATQVDPHTRKQKNEKITTSSNIETNVKTNKETQSEEVIIDDRIPMQSLSLRRTLEVIDRIIILTKREKTV